MAFVRTASAASSRAMVGCGLAGRTALAQTLRRVARPGRPGAATPWRPARAGHLHRRPGPWYAPLSFRAIPRAPVERCSMPARLPAMRHHKTMTILALLLSACTTYVDVDVDGDGDAEGGSTGSVSTTAPGGSTGLSGSETGAPGSTGAPEDSSGSTGSTGGEGNSTTGDGASTDRSSTDGWFGSGGSTDTGSMCVVFEADAGPTCICDGTVSDPALCGCSDDPVGWCSCDATDYHAPCVHPCAPATCPT